MNILYLGPQSCIMEFLKKDNVVIQSEQPFPITGQFDCIVSYRYRHKIPIAAIKAVKGKAINLHISYLPYNRGANPNYWSWYDDTLKGVTIHYVDEGFDTGDIILQKPVCLKPTDTLRQTYEVLSREIESLFINNWNHIFKLPRYPQQGEGTIHRKADSVMLNGGWDMPCWKVGEEIFGWDQ